MSRTLPRLPIECLNKRCVMPVVAAVEPNLERATTKKSKRGILTGYGDDDDDGGGSEG